MFDLEPSIAEWRRQMLAAGIKSPVPLEELECHLREEIERQMESGTSEQQAFEIAAQEIGRAELLRTEFKRAGFLNWCGGDKNTRINRVFALLWLASCSWGFFSLATGFLLMIWDSVSLNSHFGINAGLLLALLLEGILLRGMIASIRLFAGNNKEIRPIRFIAMIYLVGVVASMVTQMISKAVLSPVRSGHFTQVTIVSLLQIGIIALSLASVFLLRSPQQQDPDKAKK